MMQEDKAGACMKMTIRLALLAFLMLSIPIAKSGESPRAIYNRICKECHEEDYFKGEDTEQVARNIGRISRGELKHKKKFTLSEEEILAVAQLLSTGE